VIDAAGTMGGYAWAGTDWVGAKKQCVLGRNILDLTNYWSIRGFVVTFTVDQPDTWGLCKR
jgi:hypothetical protein